MDRYRTGALLSAAAGNPKSILKRESDQTVRRKTNSARVSFGSESTSEMIENMTAQELLSKMISKYGDECVVSTNFGPNSAVLLHLATRVKPNIPIVWVDTGYLSEETYRYAEQLTKLLNLNLKVYQPQMSRSRMEAIYGKLWETDEKEFGRLCKLEPMKRAINELKVKSTIIGLRSTQLGKSAKSVGRVSKDSSDRYRVLPIFDWSDDDINQYVEEHGLPSHGTSSGPRRDALRYADIGISSADIKSNNISKNISQPQMIKTVNKSSISNVEVYTKMNSALCVRAKTLLEEKNVEFTEFIVDVDIAEDQLIASIGVEKAAAPYVFMDGEYVGGFNELCEKLSEDPRRHVGVWGRGLAAVRVALN